VTHVFWWRGGGGGQRGGLVKQSPSEEGGKMPSRTYLRGTFEKGGAGGAQGVGVALPDKSAQRN